MDAEPGVTGQVEGKNVIPMLRGQGPAQHMVELLCAPCAVHTAEAPALQLDSQFAVGGQRILGVAHFVMEEADGCQICFYGGSRLPMLLQIQHIANKVLATDVAQFLKVVLVSQVAAEPLARFVVAILGAETALTIMAGQFVQLTHQGQIEALVLNGSCHIVKYSFSFIGSSDGRSSPIGRAVCFRRISRKIFLEPGGNRFGTHCSRGVSRKRAMNGESLSLFQLEPGQYERSMGIDPAIGGHCSDDDCRHNR